ncbi:hypothetical protein Godav_004885 [Gossypium davidsonii]|uniref:Uncharacterized protein n=1 Tax=Gossypium davidsonii TaxID=34287 RepID=A0A7J8SMQ6_GOSDV|nr:hypothetical protein [Gossypium davidsonii]
MSFCTLPIPKLSESEGAFPPWNSMQNTCFWWLCTMQENVVFAATPCTSMQRISMPRTTDLKEHLRRLQQQSDSRRRAAVMEMMRQRAAEVAGSSGEQLSLIKPATKFPTKKANLPATAIANLAIWRSSNTSVPQLADSTYLCGMPCHAIRSLWSCVL